MGNLNQSTLIHSFESENKGISYSRLIILLFLSLLIGGLSGFGLSKIQISSKGEKEFVKASKNAVGVMDKKTFRDKAEGILREGGIDGEGNFHLERPGGESQNVYLTSSTIDLSLYIGKKVRVWGETFAGEKAGWLMDVGLVEVLQ
jgi:hypothetical protein